MKEKINDKLDKLFEKPIIAIPLSIFLFYLFMIPADLMKTTVGIFAVKIVTGAVLTAVVFWLRKDHMYSCGFRKWGKKNFLLFAPVIVIAACTILFSVVKNGVTVKTFFFLSVLSLEAGFCEEVMCRGIPLGNTVWKRKNFRQIVGLLIYTSILFGVLHITNVLQSGSLLGGVMQVISTTFFGLYCGAIYLRSGSVLPNIMAHFLYDYSLMLLAFKNAGADVSIYANKANQTSSNGVAGILVQILLPLCISAFWFVCSMVLLRKSKRNEIMANFAKE